MLEPEPQKSQRQPMHHGHLPVPPAPGAAWLCWAPVSHRVLRPRWWEGWRDGLRALCVCLPDFTTPLRPSFLTSFTNSSLQTFLPRWGCCQDYRARLLITTYHLFHSKVNRLFLFFFFKCHQLGAEALLPRQEKVPPDPELVGAAGAAPPVQLRLCSSACADSRCAPGPPIQWFLQCHHILRLPLLWRPPPHTVLVICGCSPH